MKRHNKKKKVREDVNEKIRQEKILEERQKIIDNYDRHKFGEWYLKPDQFTDLTCEYRERGLVCVEGFKRDGYCTGCYCDAYIEYDTFWHITKDGIEVEVERYTDGTFDPVETHVIPYDEVWPYIRTNDEEIRQVYDFANDELRELWDRDEDLDEWYVKHIAKTYKVSYLIT